LIGPESFDLCCGTCAVGGPATLGNVLWPREHADYTRSKVASRCTIQTSIFKHIGTL
jgi:hypothetical protein